jgi:hypothetical protein
MLLLDRLPYRLLYIVGRQYIVVIQLFVGHVMPQVQILAIFDRLDLIDKDKVAGCM